MLNKILAELKESKTTLVAVSKTKPVSAIQQLYDQGQRIFGENRVQELVDKQEQMPKDIQWHLIGHLQTNKVKYMASFVSMIHSVDSLKLLKEINKQAAKHDRVIPCLLQFHIAEENTKFGLDLTDAKALLEGDAFRQMSNIRIAGVMGMATFTHDEVQVRREFATLKNIYDELKASYFSAEEGFKEVSMGMSGDYQMAVSEGSTMVRIGSLLFGSR